MNSQTLYLYSSAVAMIVVLIGFSRNNRKNGWKKTRTTLAGALQNLYTDLGLGADWSKPVTVASLPVDTTEFSLQLLSLRASLGASRPIVVNPVPAAQEAPIPTRAR